MLRELRVTNFKAWQGEHRVELAPLSLFLGTNSAGKTSLMQMLLLLKQTAESPDRKQHLNLGGQPGDLLHLGGLKDIVSGNDLKRQLVFGLRFDGVARFRNSAKLKDLGPLGDPIEIEYDVSFRQAFGGMPVVRSLKYEAVGWSFTAERHTRGGYSLNAAKSRTVGEIHEADSALTWPSYGLGSQRNYEPERAVAFSADAVAALKLEGWMVQDLTLQLIKALTEIVYLGPLRDRPRRSYAWNQQSPGDLGNKGEFAIQALLASANSRIKSTEAGGSGWLVKKVSGWLQRMELADGLSLKQQGSYYEVIVHQDKIKANLADVGFGVSQVLPVVTLAYFVPEGSTVILEQPEIHLHPLAQTALADLLVEVSRSRQVQFLVETHSEHLFRRLQSLIAEEQITPEDCRLYFVKKTGNGAALDKLEVDAYGRIKSWPQKFFGDSIGEVERQTRKMIERMGKQQRA